MNPAIKNVALSLYQWSPPFVQDVLLSMEGWRIYRERFNQRADALMVEWERTQWLSLEELRELQRERLQALVRHAYETVPYYRQVMTNRKLTPDDLRSLDDLHKLPVLTKDLVRANFDTLISRTHGKGLVEGHSSGTTGSPISVMWDRATAIAHNAALWRYRKWAGFELGRPYASLLGRVIVPIHRNRPPFWKYNRPWRQLFLSSFHLTEQNLPMYIDAMRRHGIEALQAYPSTAYILARYLDQTGERFPLRYVFTSSETLLDIQRQVIEDRFACQVYDSFGLAERVAYAAECPNHEGHHLFMEYGIVELLDETGTPVPEGAHGRMVATGLHNFGMPLLRYEVGDVSAYKTSPCSCGRGLPLLDKVTTKAEDIVVTPDGRFISSSVMTHPFKPMHNIEASQIIQLRPDELVIKVVRRPSYTEHDSQILLTEMHKRLGHAIRITIEFVSDIPRSANGKFRWVISKVPLQYAGQKFDNLFTE